MTDDGMSAGLIRALIIWATANAGWVILASVGYFVISLLIIRILVIRMPADYFLSAKPDPWRNAHPAASISLRILRNLLGVVVIVVGLVMSVPGVPGQGLLTLLIGLTLTDFPGKRRMEIWLLRRSLIAKAINGLRAKSGAPPILLPDGELDAVPGRGEGKDAGGRHG